MSHELEMVNGEAMMAYRASEGRPWHRLGTAVGDDLTPQEMMNATLSTSRTTPGHAGLATATAG